MSALIQYPTNKQDESYVVPANTSAIRIDAFYNCNNLVEVTLQKGITNIEAGVFYDCDNLIRACVYKGTTFSSLTFPDRTDFEIFGYNVADNEAALMYYSGKVSEVVIPDQIAGYPVTRICKGNQIFYTNETIEKVVLPEELRTIDDFSFYKCSNLKEVIFNDNLETIGTNVFSACAALMNVNLPDSVTTIGERAFVNCTNLKSVRLSQNLTEINKETFQACYALENIEIPSSVTSIGVSAFAGCDSIQTVIIPEGVMEIENYAFLSCDNLTDVYIPSTVKNIGEWVFRSCHNLESITVNGNQYFYSVDGVLFDNSEQKLLHYPANKGTLDYVVPDGTKIIGEDAFYHCNNLQSITLPSSITHIEDNAFYNCTGLKNISAYDGLLGIGEYAFENCSSLVELELPDSVTSIGTGAFRNCINLKSLIIPAGVSVLETNTFEKCHKLNYVVIPETVITINDSVFDSTYLTIYGYLNTEAEKCAERLGFTFKDLNVYTPEEDESQPDTGETVKKIHFIDYFNWGSTYLYCWRYDDSNNAINDGNWPGNAMSFIGYSDAGYRMYAIEIPAEMEYIIFNNGFLFNDGNGIQTNDIRLSYFGTENIFRCLYRESYTGVETLTLELKDIGLTLQDGLCINFTADRNFLKEVGYENPYVKVELNEEEFIVNEYTVIDGNYVFDFSEISSVNKNDTIYATLYATFDGKVYCSETKKYSIADDYYDVVKPLSGKLSIDGSTDVLIKTVGDSITLDVAAIGGCGDYTYKFAVLNVATGSWYVLKDFSDVSTYTTKLSVAGTKQFAVTIKESDGTTVATNRITVTAEKNANELSGSLQVDGSTESLIKTVGGSVTLNAVASGGNGEYTYKFAVYNEETGKWFVLKDFSSESAYTSLLKVAGAKQFAVTVKDSTGATIATNRICVTAVEGPEELSGTLSIDGSTSAITTTLGSNITLDVEAAGGNGEYTYKFAMLDVSTGNWTVIQYFSSNSSRKYALSSTGTKQFAATVMDSEGNTVATNRMTVIVTD